MVRILILSVSDITILYSIIQIFIKYIRIVSNKFGLEVIII